MKLLNSFKQLTLRGSLCFPGSGRKESQYTVRQKAAQI